MIIPLPLEEQQYPDHEFMNFPTGARWVYTAPNGDYGEVWLQSRDSMGTEVWRWSFQRKDGTGQKNDWAPSKQACVAECRTCFYHSRSQKLLDKPRFKRFKEPRTH